MPSYTSSKSARRQAAKRVQVMVRTHKYYTFWYPIYRALRWLCTKSPFWLRVTVRSLKHDPVIWRMYSGKTGRLIHEQRVGIDPKYHPENLAATVKAMEAQQQPAK